MNTSHPAHPRLTCLPALLLLIGILTFMGSLTGCGGDSPDADAPNTNNTDADAEQSEASDTPTPPTNNTPNTPALSWKAGPPNTTITAELIPPAPRARQPVELRITVANPDQSVDALVAYRVTAHPINHELTGTPPSSPPWQPANPATDNLYTATTALPQGFNHVQLLIRYPTAPATDPKRATPPSFLQGLVLDIP